ncbi:hypothetical protein IKQ21_08215 [bacterium]|nr:hypothetical protein [bacterium]
MIDGIVTPALRDIDYLTPAAPYPVVPAGITIYEKPIYRYSIPTDEQPTLSILDYIPDHNGNFIKPGYYQLALSNDREFLYLIESKDLVAIIPVFKLEENKAELRKLYASKKELTKEEKRQRNKKKREEKYKKIIEAKYAKTGATPPQEYKHMEAEIQYIKEGEYYLIKYEKGFIRAWGAIKS